MERTQAEMNTDQAAIQADFFNQAGLVRSTLVDLSDGLITVPMAIEAVRLAKDLLNRVAELDNPGEFMTDLTDLKAVTTGHLLMNVLTLDGMGFNITQKTYWLEVAETIGGDWIGSYKRVGAYMDKVWGF